jgi:hypothetical protein
LPELICDVASVHFDAATSIPEALPDHGRALELRPHRARSTICADGADVMTPSRPSCVCDSVGRVDTFGFHGKTFDEGLVLLDFWIAWRGRASSIKRFAAGGVYGQALRVEASEK